MEYFTAELSRYFDKSISSFLLGGCIGTRYQMEIFQGFLSNLSIS